MKTIGGVLPSAVVLAAIGGAIWWLLSREMAAGRWLLAALLIGHGVVHVMFAVPAPAGTAAGREWPFDMARAVGVALIAVVVIGLAHAALSTVGIVVPSGWWQPAVAMSTVASAITLILFFGPQLVLGLGIDAVLLWVVATRAWPWVP